jgi:type I restriction enzyme M protein
VGLDNDRTMARIGWMNLVLHGLENPHIFQGDSLSKREGKPDLAPLTAPESYDAVFANPPFTGTVDSNDIDGDPLRFPRSNKKDSKGNKLALTDKSELLFCWLMLDLLDIGGRCAVIVPEGLLFGNTVAHVRLRRELLTEHVVEAVISLPGGVFQPYTGVKTSVLVFGKQTRREDKREYKGQAPLTHDVWFYEIGADGYSLDAKRREQPQGANDLWDALEKFRARSQRQSIEATHYYQPAKSRERWRLVQLRDAEDKLTPLGLAFPDHPEVAAWEGRVAAMHELFAELPSDPGEAEGQVRERSRALLRDAFIALYGPAGTKALLELGPSEPMKTDRTGLAKKHLDKALTEVRRQINACKSYFEDVEDNVGWRLFQAACEDARQWAYERYVEALDHERSPSTPGAPGRELTDLAKEFAKLDGFDVTLRSVAVAPRDELLPAAKHWIVPVRAWAPNDEWIFADGELRGSHNPQGQVRPEYVQAMEAEGLYDKDGTLKDGVLDPDCIEARDWNLSAGQYKPFDFTQLRSEKSVGELIDALRAAELKIVEGLDRLKAMVEGRA